MNISGHKIIKILLLTSAFFVFCFAKAERVAASFRFTATSDTQGNAAELTKISNQIKTLPVQPALMIIPGDLTPTNSQLTVLGRFQDWQNALNGGNNNGMSAKTFAARGNHDLPDTATWTNFFQFGPLGDSNSVASKIGASNYSALNDDLTYSFDYQNSHFVAIDIPGNINLVTSAQTAWVDNDLRAAAARGLKHAFIFWHGALYYVDGHTSTLNPAFASMLNNHPIVTALFNGHEHQLAHTTLNKSRVSQLTTGVIEQFVVAGGGAGSYACNASRADFCQPVYGFLAVDVLNDTQIRAQFYKEGQSTPIFDRTYTKGQVLPPVNTPTPGNTIKPTTTPSGGLTPDVNSDGVVNIIDIGIVIDNYGKSNPTTPRADVNKSGMVDIIDIGIIIDNYNTATPVSRTPTPNPKTPSPNPKTATPFPTPPGTPVAGAFNFTTWGDTEKSLVTLGQISNQAMSLGPEFSLYTGDAGLGFPDGWKAAINGNNNNGMVNKTFAVRGNGDSGYNWTGAFDFAATANNIGAKNYTALTEDQTYSFDYGNSRIIGLDTPGCGSPSTTQLTWLEGRITDAISKNLTHVFLFKHGAMYYVANHTNCNASSAFISLISKYPIVIAIINGHEHLKSDIPFGPGDNRMAMSHTFHQIVTGGSGDNPYPCNASRLTGPNDYCRSVDGFGSFSVNGRTITVSFYETGVASPFHTFTINH